MLNCLIFSTYFFLKNKCKNLWSRRKKVVPLHPQKGEMAEWSIASVLKTDVLRGTGGSNPSLSAEKPMGNSNVPLNF